jgi:hypothetical protein
MNKRGIIKIVCGVIGAVVVPGFLLPFTVGTRARQRCTFCHGERTDLTNLGNWWQRNWDAEFTRWYRCYRPAHAHEWGHLTCIESSSAFGIMRYFGCGPRHPALFSQISLYSGA